MDFGKINNDTLHYNKYYDSNHRRLTFDEINILDNFLLKVDNKKFNDLINDIKCDYLFRIFSKHYTTIYKDIAPIELLNFIKRKNAKCTINVYNSYADIIIFFKELEEDLYSDILNKFIKVFCDTANECEISKFIKTKLDDGFEYKFTTKYVDKVMKFKDVPNNDDHINFTIMTDNKS